MVRTGFRPATRPARPRAPYVAGVLIAVVVLAGMAYLLGVSRSGTVGGTGGVTPGSMTFVSLGGGGSSVATADTDGVDPRDLAPPLSCLRIYAAAGTTVCLRLSGPGPTYAADVHLDDRATAVRTVGLPGVPSRARVSPSGDVVAWTSFVTGDSYLMPGGFSTRTGMLDVRTGELIESLESFRAEVDGAVLVAEDINYWGVTFAEDDRTFYATLASGGRTWLVQGDRVDRVVRSIRGDVECPSLSPDGTLVAFKRKVGRFGPWELAVVDLATGRERSLPGTLGIDDQAEWADSATLLYAAVPPGARVPAIHRVPADGSAPAEILIPDATSPTVAR